MLEHAVDERKVKSDDSPLHVLQMNVYVVSSSSGQLH